MGHWHAYSYTGHQNPGYSNLPSETIPPMEVAFWLDRPARAIVDTFEKPDPALDWLRQQLEEHPYPYAIDGDPMWKLRYAEENLYRGDDVVWGWYPNSNRYVTRVLINCPRTDKRCPTGG